MNTDKHTALRNQLRADHDRYFKLGERADESTRSVLSAVLRGIENAEELLSHLPRADAARYLFSLGFGVRSVQSPSLSEMQYQVTHSQFTFDELFSEDRFIAFSDSVYETLNAVRHEGMHPSDTENTLENAAAQFFYVPPTPEDFAAAMEEDEAAELEAKIDRGERVNPETIRGRIMNMTRTLTTLSSCGRYRVYQATADDALSGGMIDVFDLEADARKLANAMNVADGLHYEVYDRSTDLVLWDTKNGSIYDTRP